MFQAHCCVWTHHVWVSVSLPQRLPSRRQGWFGRRGCLPTQVSLRSLLFMSFFSIFFSKSRAWPWVWGPAQEAAHQSQVFPGEQRPDSSRLTVCALWSWYQLVIIIITLLLLLSPCYYYYHLVHCSGITYERNWPWESKGNAIKSFYILINILL